MCSFLEKTDMFISFLIKKLKKGLIHKLLRKYGSTSIKQWIWNEEFRVGQWDYLDNTEHDPIYPFIEKYCSSGDILDLGCGAGNTGSELSVYKYRFYFGVDVSEEAIKKAQARCHKSDRDGKNFYYVGEIENYVPDKKYSVILFRESIFYLPLEKMHFSLQRLRQYLTDDGVLIIRMCDRLKYARIIKIIEENFDVIERHHVDGEKGIILVHR